MSHFLVNKQLQFTYWPISLEGKGIRQWNLVSQGYNKGLFLITSYVVLGYDFE